ncbi:MAG: branched-chain amino acid ABC transporter permease [Burkholderiaceae bacterium]
MIAFLYQYFDNIGFLILAAVGLIVIYGMMGVINMAHGELMMIGAYLTSFTYHAGAPSAVAIAFGGLGAMGVGVLLERFVIRRFYNQLLSSLVVTWGLSIVISQGFLLVFGPSAMNLPTPFGNLPIGEQTFGIYRIVMFAVAVALVAAVWYVLRFTSFGVLARATMENPGMTEALGVSTQTIYAATFGGGALLAGIAGGMFALTATISPFFGSNYTPLAFITIVVGGAANPISGLVSSVLALAGVQTVANALFSVYTGYIAMFTAAVIVLIALPRGISDYLERRRLQALRHRRS